MPFAKNNRTVEFSTPAIVAEAAVVTENGSVGFPYEDTDGEIIFPRDNNCSTTCVGSQSRSSSSSEAVLQQGLVREELPLAINRIFYKSY